ncbi:tip elongation aberrant protein 1-like isoform X3 [Diospyros lotus]|uniref:tip elongation aberrant protein 1-like isoform X3 n=1 Tax=Diospyros lotus TaxID=55363 RepID=UPI002259660B|nr:tip elongation aberrant protein 1-like isoform X3 [Diospyros lotus]
MRWEKLQSNQEKGPTPTPGPGKRWGHSCNAIRGGSLLYVFGGHTNDSSQTNQLHIFHTATRTWSEPVVKGTPPAPRDSHSCTAVGDNLFVFGGTDGTNPLNDLQILDTSTNTWSSPIVRGEMPEARESHSAALIGKWVFIFGGSGKSSNTSDEEFYGDVYILDTETYAWIKPVTLGTPPAKRSSHTCSSWKNQIIVIGGEDSYGHYFSDVHILDADTLGWRKLNTSGEILPPQAGHTTVSLGTKLFVFGGFSDSTLQNDIYMLDVDTGVWTKVMTVGERPSPRFSVAGDSLDPEKSDALVFLGGCNKNLDALDDMYYLHTGTERENDRDEQHVGKLSLTKQLKIKCKEKKLFANPANADCYQPTPMPSIPDTSLREDHTPQKRTFHAMITNSFPIGYAIETIIDGKLLRGVVFSDASSSNHANDNSKRKKVALEINPVNLNGNEKQSSETARPGMKDKVDEKPADVTGTNREAAAVSSMGSLAPSDMFLHSEQQVPGNLSSSSTAGRENVEDKENGSSQVPERG